MLCKQIFTRKKIFLCSLLCLALTGCAKTSVSITPQSNDSICNHASSALVLWTTQWRPNQKDVKDREAIAARGLSEFWDSSACFSHINLRHIATLNANIVSNELTLTSDKFDKIIIISVRELGPVVKLFSSPLLIEGGTMVVLDVAEYKPLTKSITHKYTIHWNNGGTGVIKGVSTLSDDMKSALSAGF